MVSSIIVFLVVLSLLILVHELGHFLMARRSGVWVEEFGFGLPPRLWGKRIGETLYSINLLPFGGFVRMHGEASETGVTKPRRAFVNKSKRVKTLIIVAGVMMNFLLGVVAFAIVYSFSGIPRDSGRVEVLEVVPGSPAQTAKLVVGDTIKSVNGQAVTKTKDFVSLVEEKKGSKVTLEVERNGQVRKVGLTPRESPPEEEGPLGVVITSTEIYFPPFWQRPFIGAYYGVKEAFFWGQTIVVGLWGLIVNLFRGIAPEGIAGPVGIYAITSQAASYGALAVINFAGILSVNLAILNIVPFPALDGGRLLFIFLEGILGRKVLPKWEAAIHAVGLVILIILLLAVTVGDIKRLVEIGSLTGFVESVLK